MSKYSLDRFLEACGAAGPLRLTVNRGGTTDDHALPQPFALIGSDPRADVRVADGRFPRRAAFLQVLGGRLLGLDLTADPAGRIGSHPPHHWLTPGEEWPFGGLTIRLAADNAGTSDSGSLLRREDLPAAALEITGGSRGVCQYSFKAPIVLIGKSPKCQVRLKDSAVSRFHCALIHLPAGLWAVDLLGRGGITVNGQVARAARLDEGDELRVGGFALRSRAGRPTDQNSDAAKDQPLAGFPALAPPTVPEWVPAVPALSDALGANAGAALAPVVSLIVALQQQMAEQHRLAMTSVIDSFRQMHAEQMRMIWDELAHFRRLTEEVTSLKATLAQLPAAPAAHGPPGRPTAGSVPVDKPAPSPVRPSADRPTPVRRPVATDRIPDPGPTKPAPVERDVHAWLSQRVAAAQKEREGRWQKIVSFLTGAPQ
jgi:hypothetical protein